jgi:MATE family multidrug resistance protein
MSSNKSIPSREPSGRDRRPSRVLGTSYRSQTAVERYQASVAEESIARDLDDDQAVDQVLDTSAPAHDQLPTTQHSMTSSYRRPSYYASGPRPIFGIQPAEAGLPAEQDWETAIGEERSLLRDNKILPPKHPRKQGSVRSLRSAHGSSGGVLRKVLETVGFATETKRSAFHGSNAVPADSEEDANNGPALEEVESIHEDAENEVPDETTALLGRDPSAPYGGEGSPENVSRKWEEAVLAGQIQTTWQRETKVLARYSAPLMLTFILQNSLTLTSIFTVGHIGKVELGAVSLGGMTATITGYAVYQGLATSLDTLCAQAYGSGKRKLVGLQLQRMVFFLWAITIPISILWFFATPILEMIVPEQEIADYSGQYLRILIIGAPAYACFESGKRYVQAQGRFEATLYVLLIAAPFNAFLHWLFVWRFQWGFIGCPIAVVITECFMPILLLLYVRFIAPNGMECWPGFTNKAFRNWGPMIRLALPGLVMVLAEFLAFEILTLASARISATHLAANTVLQSLSILTYQLPFPLSIAASTRVANLIGASLPDAAKITAQVAFVGGTVIGLLNMIVLSSLRFQIPWLFTSEEDVVALAAAVLPVNAAFQLFDALAAICNGCLRGLGKQEVGGYINLFAYYVVSSSPAAPFAPPIPKPVFISLAPDANLLISIR